MNQSNAIRKLLGDDDDDDFVFKKPLRPAPRKRARLDSEACPTSSTTNETTIQAKERTANAFSIVLYCERGYLVDELVATCVKLRFPIKFAKVMNCDITSELVVTHYLCDVDKQVGLIKTPELYKAIAKGMWVLQPSWLKDSISLKVLLPEDLYTLEKLAADILENHILYKNPKCPDNGNPLLYEFKRDLFSNTTFLFLDLYPLKHFCFENKQLMQIIRAAGGFCRKMSISSLMTPEFQKPGKEETVYAVINRIGVGGQIPLKEIHRRKKILSVHPQYILDCIWFNAVVELEPIYVFTPQNNDFK